MSVGRILCAYLRTFYLRLFNSRIPHSQIACVLAINDNSLNGERTSHQKWKIFFGQSSVLNRNDESCFASRCHKLCGAFEWLSICVSHGNSEHFFGIVFFFACAFLLFIFNGRTIFFDFSAESLVEFDIAVPFRRGHKSHTLTHPAFLE